MEGGRLKAEGGRLKVEDIRLKCQAVRLFFLVYAGRQNDFRKKTAKKIQSPKDGEKLNLSHGSSFGGNQLAF